MSLKQKQNLLATTALAFTLFLTVPSLASAQSTDLYLCQPSATDSSGDVFRCVSRVYNFAIVICSIGAVLYIIFGGYIYLFSAGNASKAAQGKSYIYTSLSGILILLAGFLILKQINPEILRINSISPQRILEGDIAKSSVPITTSTGDRRPVNVGQWKDLINSISARYNMDPCILSTIIEKESRSGNPDAVGHDNHNGNTDPFIKTSPPKFGLNWQYSHGLGLTQWTIFPLTHAYGQWPNPNVPTRFLFGKHYTGQEFLNPELSLNLTARYMDTKLKQAGGNLEKAFTAYNGATVYGQDAMRRYNTCLANK